MIKSQLFTQFTANKQNKNGQYLHLNEILYLILSLTILPTIRTNKDRYPFSNV